MKLLILFMTFFSLSSYGQTSINFTKVLEHNGGNGGDDYEIMIKSNLMNISHFLNSETGKIVFRRDLDSKQFSEAVKSVDIRIVNENLYDKFSAQRCALNFPDEKLVVFNRKCVELLHLKPQDFFVLISHEVLNIMGLELPDDKGGSIYPISTRIGEMSGVIKKETRDIILNQSCDLDIGLLIEEIELPDMAKKILKEKGYKKINFGGITTFSKNNVHLDLTLLSVKMDKLVVSKNMVVIQDKEFEVNHTLMNSKFDGFLVATIQRGSYHLFTPVKLSVTKVKFTDVNPNESFKSFRSAWRPTGTGKHFTLSLKKGYKAALMESLLKTPSCVTF